MYVAFQLRSASINICGTPPPTTREVVDPAVATYSPCRSIAGSARKTTSILPGEDLISLKSIPTFSLASKCLTNHRIIDSTHGASQEKSASFRAEV